MYVALTYSCAALLLLLAIPFRPPGRVLQQVWRRHWRSVLLAGWLSPATYLLVLFAMRLAPVAYIVPLRSFSILFSMLFGVGWLKERSDGPKWLATICMMAGMVLIARWG